MAQKVRAREKPINFNVSVCVYPCSYVCGGGCDAVHA